MKLNLIASCGMNCAICIGYLREKNKCPGCKKIDSYESSYCKKCIIRSCLILKQNKMKFCSNKCDKYPCQRLKNLDKRYITKYKMSMIDNLKFINDTGIKMFIKKEKEKWTCKKCGWTLCVHRDSCLKCGNKKKY